MSRPKRSAPLITAVATLALLLVLVACRDDSPTQTGDSNSTPTSDSTPTPTPGPTYDVELARNSLATAKARWKAEGTANYELESLVRCRCPESNRPLKIMVRNGVIESIIDLESGRALTERDYVDTYTYHTIDDRFDQIESAVSGPLTVYHLRVEYHPTLGYPTTLGINYNHNAIDSGFTLERLVYKPLDSSPSPATSTLSLDTEGRHASVLDLFSGGDAMFSIGPAATVEEVLEKGLRLAGASPVHLEVLRMADVPYRIQLSRDSRPSTPLLTRVVKTTIGETPKYCDASKTSSLLGKSSVTCSSKASEGHRNS